MTVTAASIDQAIDEHLAAVKDRQRWLDPEFNADDRAEWGYLWGQVAAVYNNPTCYNERSGEAWQYMGTWRGEDGIWRHQLRHRDLPAPQGYILYEQRGRVNIQVPAARQ